MWYGSEILQHRDSIDGEMLVDSCVTIHLKETTHEVRLEYSEITFCFHFWLCAKKKLNSN